MAAASLWGRKDVQFVAALLHVCACTCACFHSGTLPSFTEQWLSLLSSMPYLLSLSPFFMPLRWDLCIEQNQSCNGIHPFWRVLRTVVWYTAAGERLFLLLHFGVQFFFSYSHQWCCCRICISVSYRGQHLLSKRLEMSQRRDETPHCVSWHLWWYAWGSDVSAVPFSLLLS